MSASEKHLQYLKSFNFNILLLDFTLLAHPKIFTFPHWYQSCFCIASKE